MENNRAAIYARVSLVDKNQDPQLQIAQMKEHCSRNNIEVVTEIYEHASGANDERKGLKKIIDLTKEKKFNILMVTAFDRLGRSTISFLKTVATLDDHGIRLVSLRENFNTTDNVGRFMLQILVSVAELERKMISQRIAQALYNKKLIATQTGNGWRCGRPKTLTTEIEQKILNLRTQGKSLRSIANALNISKTSVLRAIKSVVQKDEKK